MNKNDIKKLLQNGERLTLEAKLAKTDVPKSVWMRMEPFELTKNAKLCKHNISKDERTINPNRSLGFLTAIQH